VAGMCDRIELFFVGTGVRPQANTSDPGWNAAARDFWNDWVHACDVRGESSYYDLQAITLGCRPTQGGLYYELLDNGQIRPIECERIRDPSNPGKTTDFKRYVDGVKRDGAGRVLGYWVHQRDKDGGFTGEHSEEFVPRDSVIPVTRHPWRADQCREIPDLAPVIPVLWDIHEMNVNTLNTAKMRSGFFGVHTTLEGQGSKIGMRGSPSTPTVGQREAQRVDWGWMLRGLPGEKIDFPSINMPDPQHIPYMKFQILVAASAMNMPYDFFALDFSSLDFSRMKGLLMMVNRVRNVWLSRLNQNMNRRIWNWRIAMEMKPGKFLSPAPVDARGVSEWHKVKWRGDAELGVDRKEGDEADMVEAQVGFGTYDGAIERRGGNARENLTANARYLKLVDEIAKAEGVDPNKLFNATLPGQAVQKEIKQGDAPGGSGNRPT
jgi:capsid protein